MSSTESSTCPSLEQADTNNATIIRWYESTNGYDPDDEWYDDHYPLRYGDWYQNADLTNNGYKNGEWWNKPFYTWLENDRMIEICSGQLPLTRQERAHAKNLFHRLRGEKFGTHKEVFAVATCLYSVEMNETDNRRVHPNVPEDDEDSDGDDKKPKEFFLENVSQHFNITEKWLRKAYGRIERWRRLGELDSSPIFDKNREKFPLEYEHQLTELWLEESK